MLDQNDDKIDDDINLFAGEDWFNVELIFKEQITQKQIDDFLLLGGEITYIYQAVSYGWNAWIPAESLTDLPGVMGGALVRIQGPGEVVACMDVATQTGRVRPIWKGNFAGNPSGFDGDPNITIGILDTGVDASHLDLAGRCVYWGDFASIVSTRASSPTDPAGHGSHVAGIAVGTGQSAEKQQGTLRHTSRGNLSALSATKFYSCPVSLSAGSAHVEATAIWQGGSTAELKFLASVAGRKEWYTRTIKSGPSPLSLWYDFLPSVDSVYTLGLFNMGGLVEDYVIVSSVTGYPGVDGFSRLSGVAPGCSWAGARVLGADGKGLTTRIQEGIDDLVAKRRTHNIKILNLSMSMKMGGKSDSWRQKINSAVRNGIVVVAAAGNDGLEDTSTKREIADPSRAALAITAGASNDQNALIDRSSHGFSNPSSSGGKEEDYKPDIIAPGGSSYYSMILSVDSGSNDGPGFADQQPDDYCSDWGTSMSSPFIAGCAALVIDAMQRRGIVWDFQSDKQPRYVKMLLCATATETNANRENGQFNPSLQRAANGPDGFPAGKDPYEGYGIINPDAAVEAVALNYAVGSTASEIMGPSVADRRAWARTLHLSRGRTDTFLLDNPRNGDFDLYLYDAKPSQYGTPVILAASTVAGEGLDESITYTCSSDDDAILVVKRVSGAGQFTISSTEAAGFYALAHDAPLTFSDVPKTFSFEVFSYDWCCVGINPSTDHDIRVADNAAFNNFVKSSRSGTTRDFVVLNGHRLVTGRTCYVEVYYGTPSTYVIEAEWDVTDLVLESRVQGSMSSSEVFDMYEVALIAAKRYRVSVDITSGDADLAIYLFAGSRDSGTRGENDGWANNAFAGGDETLTFTANASAEYGVVVTNENGKACSYTIEVTPTY